ncbi:MAG: Cytochrome c oxidase polypeptide [Hyphomicrobiales bacterium]|nr:Cytochrome c oxidase polypeptide [Hyphomicrobiales bacterium]
MTGQFFRSLGAALVAMLALGLPSAVLANEPGHPVPAQIGFQDSVTPIMDSIETFHNNLLMWVITAIVLLVLALLVIVIVRFNVKANPVPSRTTHNTLIEIAWTVLPILVLVVIAIPSFGILTDQLSIPDGVRKYLGPNIFSFGQVAVPAPALTVKATGVQWYWNYTYVDDQNKQFDSLIKKDADLKAGDIRLLSVDNPMVVPVDTTVRMQVTGGDVIHSFSVPSFGIKIDAVPGRLNETWFNSRKTGMFYGQCSQLCGKDHAFMPIAVRVVTQEQFKTWLDALHKSGIDAANQTLAAL